MKYLLDTHVWIWAVNDDLRLPKKYRKLLSKTKATDCAMLDISVWEAGRVHKANELTLGDPRIWFSIAIDKITLLPITPAIALLEQSLNWNHKDPADRLIAACALVHALPLMTVDKRFTQWGGVQVI
jgi:PIN domain nuclease of toxin-antitoxin system